MPLRFRPELFTALFAFGTCVELTPSTSPTRFFGAAAGFPPAFEAAFFVADFAFFATFFTADTVLRTTLFGIDDSFASTSEVPGMLAGVTSLSGRLQAVFVSHDLSPAL